MFAIFELGINFISAYIGVDFITQFFSSKYNGWKKRIFYWGTCFLYGIILTAINAIVSYEGVAGMMYLAVLFFYARVALKGHAVEHFGVAMMWMFILTISAMLVGKIIQFFSHSTFSEVVKSENAFRFYGLITVTLVKYLISRLLLLFHMDKKLELEKQESISFIIVLVAIFILIIGFMELEVVEKYEDIRLLVTILLLMLMIILIFSTYSYFRRLSSYRQKALEVDFIKSYMAEQRLNMTELIRMEEDIQIMRHDMKDFVNSVYLLLKSEKMKAAIEYIEEWDEEMKKYRPIPGLTANMGINAVLSRVIQDCLERGITFSYQISGNVDKFPELDMGMLLANGLNNAEEACNRTKEEAYIRLDIHNYQNYLKIVIKNSIAASVLEKNPHLYTTKKNAASHGYGHKSMERIAEKYDGMMKFEEENGEFIVHIMLKIHSDR